VSLLKIRTTEKKKKKRGGGKELDWKSYFGDFPPKFRKNGHFIPYYHLSNAMEYYIRKVQKVHGGLQLNWTQWFLGYTDDIN
jgi:hypothetical protein